MTDLPFLQERLKDLLSIRYAGEADILTRTLDAEERVRFRDDQQLAHAIADCERRIQKLEGSRVNTVRISSSKGL